MATGLQSSESTKRHGMSQIPLYPLRFEPIYQYRLWGGRRLTKLLAAPLPGDGPIGEAWLLSDRDDHPSRVANGPLRGTTLRQLLEQFPERLLGTLAGRFPRFPVLLKFLDARDKLSVQVHPADGQTEYIPPGESGKTEAWVVLEAGPKSRIYAGLKRGTTRADLTGLASARWGTIWPASHRRSATPFLSEPEPFTLSAMLWCSKCRKTATSHFVLMTGIGLTPTRASLDRCKSSRQWPASISTKSQSDRSRRQ